MNIKKVSSEGLKLKSCFVSAKKIYWFFNTSGSTVIRFMNSN